MLDLYTVMIVVGGFALFLFGGAVGKSGNMDMDEYDKKELKNLRELKWEYDKVIAKKWNIPHEFTAEQYLKLLNDLELAQELNRYWDGFKESRNRKEAKIHADYKIIIDGLKESNEKTV